LDEIRAEIRATQRKYPRIVLAFHRLFYRSPWTWGLTTWRGHPMWKAVTDAWIYQQILWDIRPDLIIETGTGHGGTALFLADLLELFQVEHGVVATIELHPEKYPAIEHPRVIRFTGSSTSLDTVVTIHHLASTRKRVMVILDSDHSPAHIWSELVSYAPLVTPGSFLIVEDTNLGVVVPHESGEHVPGPHDVIGPFLAAHPDFEQEALAERYLLSFNHGGYLRRKR